MSAAHHQHPHQHHPTGPTPPVGVVAIITSPPPPTSTSDHDSSIPAGPTTPPSDHNSNNNHLIPEATGPHVRLMCSFGGRILPRPQDNQLRYFGGETRIVSVNRQVTFPFLLSKLSKLSGLPPDMSVKYQLPNEDLDALISVTTDEDVENMMEEYHRVCGCAAAGRMVNGHRLRLFLFSSLVQRPPSTGIRSAASQQNWFVEALNGGGVRVAQLERSGRSEASSMMSSEVPDYLFGLDSSCSEEQYRHGKIGRSNTPVNKTTLLESSVSNTTINPPYCCGGSPPPMPHLPPVKTKPSAENVDQHHHNQEHPPSILHHVEPNRPSSSGVTQAQAVQQQQQLLPRRRQQQIQLEEEQKYQPKYQQLPPQQQQQYYVPQPTTLPVFYVPSPIPFQLSSYNQQQQQQQQPNPLPVGSHQLPTAVPYHQPMYNHHTGGVLYVASTGSMNMRSITAASSPLMVVEGYDYPIGLAPSDGDGIHHYARPTSTTTTTTATAAATTTTPAASPIYDYPAMISGTGIDIPTITTVVATAHTDRHTNC